MSRKVGYRFFPHMRYRSSEHALPQLQQSRRIAAHDLLPLLAGHPDAVHHLEAFPLEWDQRRRIGAEQEMLGADRLEAHLRRQRRVARRIEIHHPQIVAGRMLDQPRLVRTEEEGEIREIVGIVHAADDLAETAAEMAAHELECWKLLEEAAHDQPRERKTIVGR